MSGTRILDGVSWDMAFAVASLGLGFQRPIRDGKIDISKKNKNDSSKSLIKNHAYLENINKSKINQTNNQIYQFGQKIK